MCNDEPLKGSEELKRNVRHLVMLGGFASASATVEYIAELILLGLIGSDQKFGGATIRWISTQQQFELIKKICAEQYGVDSVQHKTVRDGIRAAEETLRLRNHYVHALYYLGNPAQTYRQLFKRGQFDAPLESLDLQQMSIDLTKAADGMKNFIQSAIDADLPFPRTSQDNEGG